MRILARAHIFTGIPDPEWELSEKDVATFSEVLLELERFRNSNVLPADGPIPGLGYRGFSLQIESEHGWRAISCFRERISIHDRGEWIHIKPIDGMPADEFLAGTLYRRPERAWVRRYIRHRLRLDALGTGCCTCQPQSVGDDDHDDAIWNARKDLNNCYSYALNLGPEDTPAGIRRPGFKKFGKCQDIPEYTFWEPAKPGFVDMSDALEADGLTAIPDTPVPVPRPEKSLHYTAAFLNAPDFHFYRQHSSGRWSCKSGVGGVVRHFTPGGCWIVDPRQDFFDPGQQSPGGVFCGFYLVDMDAIDVC
jgi:hypothetical protein